MSKFWTEMECEALYSVPIEELNLQLGTASVLQRTGISTVGDCIDHLLRIETGDAPPIRGYGEDQHENLQNQMKTQGFWDYLELVRERSYIWTDAICATKD